MPTVGDSTLGLLRTPRCITDRQISVLRRSAESDVTKNVTNSGRESFFAAGPPSGRGEPQSRALI